MGVYLPSLDEFTSGDSPQIIFSNVADQLIAIDRKR
jgi:hypothetical protein